MVYIPIDPSHVMRVPLIPSKTLPVRFVDDDLMSATKKGDAEFFERLAQLTNHAGYAPKSGSSSKVIILNNGGASPFAISSVNDGYKLGEFVQSFVSEECVGIFKKNLVGHSQFVKEYWNNADMQRVFNALRSAFYPLPLAAKRLQMKRLVEKYCGGVGVDLDVLTDYLLYNPSPLKMRHQVEVATDYSTFDEESLSLDSKRSQISSRISRMKGGYETTAANSTQMTSRHVRFLMEFATGSDG